MNKFSLSLIFVVFILAALVFPVSALDYNPGVIVGQYVKYGNFVGSGQGFESFNEISYQQFEVTAVSGRDVTLLSTGQYKNGTALPGNGVSEVWNVEAGTQNGVDATQGPIIAAGLNQGDAIPPPNTYSINATEDRAYLGVSRAVNLLSVSISTSDYNLTLFYVYDKASGFLLEASSQTVTQSEPSSVTSSYSYSVIETNIFTSTTPSSSLSMVYIVVPVVVIVIIVVVLILLLNRKRL